MLFGMPAEQPWLDIKAWTDNRIASDARRAHRWLWGFALFWNLVTLPLFFQFDEIWQKVQREPLTSLVFLFPLIGLALVVLAISATRQKRRFGLTPLVMDPFPGSLGGQVGGRIETNIDFDPGRNFGVSLTCVHSRISGSGKNRSRSESVVWRGDGVCHTGQGPVGTALQFRFDIPSNLPASQPQKGGNYHLWRVRVSADLPGIDFDRGYEIPVFSTGEEKSGIEWGTESHPATIDAASVIPLQRDGWLQTTSGKLRSSRVLPCKVAIKRPSTISCTPAIIKPGRSLSLSVLPRGPRRNCYVTPTLPISG